jgi:UDP-glucose 4-epimerase
MQTKDSVVARLMRCALGGGAIQIYGDGEQRRDYVYVTDTVAAIEIGLGLGRPETLTIGAGRSVSMNELWQTACEVTGVAIPADHVAAKPGEMPAVVVDTSRARTLGYAPAYDLAAGLAATWEDFEANGGGGAP